MRNLALALIYSVVLGSCFNPNLDDYAYVCNAQSPSCPDGYICVGGLCKHGDFGTGAQGCSSGQGYLMGTGIWACPGSFGPGRTATSLCAANFEPCINGVILDLNLCQDSPATVSGFFYANVSAYHIRGSAGTTSMCGAAPSIGYSNMWFGCGRIGPAYVVNFPNGCSSFTRAVDCGVTGAPLKCSTETPIDQLASDDPASGVLCCPVAGK